MEYVIEPSQIPTVAVEGISKRFPVRRIFCVGRNYAEHTREMGGDPTRERPFFFTKPADAVVDSGTTIPFPRATNNLHHEMELVVAIGKEGVNIDQTTAQDHIFGFGAGIDLTRRDLQQIAKDKRRPWDSGKAFDQSAPCAALTPAANVPDISKANIWLTVNGDLRQSATIGDLIWSIEEVIAILSTEFMLKPGDLIYTGTPAGVGPVEAGDKIEGFIDGLASITITLK
jgi:fumarylpyruvate hydrolase